MLKWHANHKATLKMSVVLLLFLGGSLGGFLLGGEAPSVEKNSQNFGSRDKMKDTL